MTNSRPEPLLRWQLTASRDLVVLRQRVDQATRVIGCNAVTRTRWATAASDIGRGILDSGGGEAALSLRGGEPDAIELLLVSPGWIDRATIDNARRLIGEIDVDTDLAGTTIRLAIPLPTGATAADTAAALREAIESHAVGDHVTALHSEKRRLEDAFAALKAAQSARERLSSIQRTVLEVLPDVVWSTDSTGRVVYVNPRWTELTGRPPAPPVDVLDAIADADREDARRLWAQAIDAAAEIRFEARIRTAHGDHRWVLFHGQPHRRDDRRLEWIGAITDIHDTKLREIESARMGEFRDRMVGVVGHDLRSPLWFIGTAARMLLAHGEDPERRVRYLEQIVDNVERSRRMIDALLDWTRTQLGAEIVCDREPVDLTAMLRTLADQAAVTHPDRAVEVEGLVEVVIDADRDRLMQATGNLLANALAYGRPGHPVRLWVEDTPDHATICVHNHGRPIASDALAHIFEPFRRGEDEEDRNRRGLGLGLYIVRAIARAHGGDAELSSTDDGQICARIELPRATTRSARCQNG
ncbi:MAG: PAS domain-containing sensor histidine kinase [Myxococcales bacterium]|nr:PAS domain-containing sensor histidine kinase [Myxococcales bacterium]MCB9543209.1 PAS domain-containing sensor histidine kinase [Myxococcales bacterium]MCB9553670.1 PAS domain-containing sensor histidine kinase [Myxococcales bacterium]